MEDNLETISRAVVDGDDKQVVKLVKDALTSGISAMDILDKGLVPGIRALGSYSKRGRHIYPRYSFQHVP